MKNVFLVFNLILSACAGEIKNKQASTQSGSSGSSGLSELSTVEDLVPGKNKDPLPMTQVKVKNQTVTLHSTLILAGATLEAESAPLPDVMKELPDSVTLASEPILVSVKDIPQASELPPFNISLSIPQGDSAALALNAVAEAKLARLCLFLQVSNGPAIVFRPETLFVKNGEATFNTKNLGVFALAFCGHDELKNFVDAKADGTSGKAVKEWERLRVYARGQNIEDLEVEGDTIWAAGSYFNGSMEDVLAMKLSTDGLIPGFADNGVFRLAGLSGPNVNDAINQINNIGLSPAGALLVGYSGLGGNINESCPLAVRLTKDGIADKTFAEKGYRRCDKVTQLPSLAAGSVFYSRAQAITYASAQEYYMVLKTRGVKLGDQVLDVMHYNNDKADDRFSANSGQIKGSGIFRHIASAKGVDINPKMITIDSKKQLYICFNVITSATYIGAVMRLKSSGELDTSFGKGGIFYMNPTFKELSRCSDIFVDEENDRAVVAGEGVYEEGGEVYAALYALTLEDGKIDESFGAKAGYTLRPSPGNTPLIHLALARDSFGRFYVVSGIFADRTETTQLGSEASRFSADGILDSLWRSGGVDTFSDVKVPPADLKEDLKGPPLLRTLAIDAYNRVVAAGNAFARP